VVYWNCVYINIESKDVVVYSLAIKKLEIQYLITEIKSSRNFYFSIAIPRFTGFTDTAKEQADKSNAAALKNAFALSRSNGDFENDSEIVITITPIESPVVGSFNVKVESSNTSELTDADAEAIVKEFMPELTIESDKNIYITMEANNGLIKSEVLTTAEYTAANS